MDLVGYDKGVFDRITLAYRAFASEIGVTNFTAIPISGFKGDNITGASPNTPWYKGPALIEDLEAVDVGASAEETKAFRLPGQWVHRRSEERRVGEECVSRCRSRWSPVHEKKKSGVCLHKR